MRVIVLVQGIVRRERMLMLVKQGSGYIRKKGGFAARSEG